MKNLSLGIDTSNYKTSVAITDEHGNIVFQRSEYLEVEKGERGLRQSIAFFRQSNAIPEMLKEAMSFVNPSDIGVIGVSDKPRRLENSYMPVFLAGVNAAETLSSVLASPVYRFSHQEGHIEAVISTANISEPKRWIMYHLSGGTTEILLCERNILGFSVKQIGGTYDISFGQLLDRVGVKMGFDFPCGEALDDIAHDSELPILPSRIKNVDGYFNLSGIETEILRAVGPDKTGSEIIPGLFYRMSQLLFETAFDLSRQYGVRTIYMAGGVASSRTIRWNISKMYDAYMEKARPEDHTDFEIVWGDRRLSGDNAVGISLLGGRTHRNWSNYR